MTQRKAAESLHTFADQLQRMLTEVREFAHRRPGVFLAGAALTGVVMGWLTRAVVAARSKPETGQPAEHEEATGTAAARSPAPAATPSPVLTEQAPVDPATPGYVMPPSGTITPPGSVTR